LKGKILKFTSDILKDGSYYKLYTQAKSTSACGLPKGFFTLKWHFHQDNGMGNTKSINYFYLFPRHSYEFLLSVPKTHFPLAKKKETENCFLKTFTLITNIEQKQKTTVLETSRVSWEPPR